MRKSIHCTYVLIKHLNYTERRESSYLLQKKFKERTSPLQLKRNSLKAVFAGRNISQITNSNGKSEYMIK